MNLDGGTGEAEAGAKGTGSSDPREVCDGVDNDGDGIIDNVDKNKDGVCDCLLIATLGVKGGSGQGDVLAAWLTARSDTGATDLADQTLTPELLAKFQVIVAQGKGHVFLWGDEWITYNSEWNDHPDYQVQLLWLNAIKWLTAAGECQVAIPPNPPK